jgi:nucleoside-diphosphate-sugar epimerase
VSPLPGPRRLLVLGAGSLIGAPLIKRLAADGVRPLCLSRRARASETFADWIQGDLEDPGLACRLPELKAVAALCPIWLVPAVLPILAARGAERLVAFSSTSRFTKAASSIAAERALAARLAAAEERVLGGAEALGVSALVLRPTLIYAEGLDGNVSRLASLISQFGVLPLSGAGEGRRQPVHAEDLAAVVGAALARPQVRGRAYELAGGETLTYRAMCERIFTALGRPPRIVSVPPPLFALALAALAPWLPGATLAMGARMARDLVFDDADARRDLDWRPRPFYPQFPAARRVASSSGFRA